MDMTTDKIRSLVKKWQVTALLICLSFSANIVVSV